jgi:NADPH-dependent 2,4-dienoyl-CoA reductase/sulfur reductase-like enzyme
LRKVEYASEHAVRLDDGTLLDADLLVVGIGVAPRVGLAQAAGVAVDDGVIVTQIAAVAEPWRDTAVPVGNDDPLVRQHGAAEVRNADV